MLDWVTARLDWTRFPREDWAKLLELGDRVQRYNPATGEVVWESHAWESIRSDSHGLTFRVGSDALWMQGSPARVIGDGCNVFGAGASAAMDVTGCVDRMRSYLFQVLPVDDPSSSAADWIVSRVDVTKNLDLGDLGSVRNALRVLRDLEGGRYRVSQKAADTVYWSHTSRLRSGKAYAKGPHLEYLMRKRGYDGKQYRPEEIAAAGRLLRLELRLGSQFWRERSGKPWHEWTREEFEQQWNDYFGRMIGDAEVTDDSDLKQRVMAAAKTEGQGRAAYGCWALIQSEGWERAREMYPLRTWYRHLKVLRAAGLADADLSAGRIVQLRRRIIEARIVTSWAEIRNVA